MNPSELPPVALQVGTPCPKRWDDLRGNDARRFCDHCHKHVHNLSVLPQTEQNRLTEAVQAGERVCIAYEQEADGTVLRREQPVKPPARRLGPVWRQRLRMSLRSIAVLCVPWLFSTVHAGPPSKDPTAPSGGSQHRNASKGPDGEMILGKPAMPTPAPTPTATHTLGISVPMPSPTASPTPTPKITLGDAVEPTPPIMVGTAVALPTPTPPMIRGEAVAVSPTPTPTPHSKK